MKLKQMYRLFIISCTTLMLFCVSHSSTVSADEGEEVGYDIQAILPENQQDKASTYFDLRMTPGQSQTVELMINNTSDKKTTYSIAINQAYTNQQGFIDYSDSTIKADKSLKYPIEDIVSYEKEVTVDAQKSMKYPIKLTMPKQSFDGQIMAGIQVMKKNDDSDNKGTISNQVGYVLGLNLTETDTPIKRKLELINVKPAVSFGKTSVVATLRNPTMEAYGKLKYVVSIENSKGEKVRDITYDSNMQVAPNSTYGLAIDWEENALVAGDYKLNLIVTDAKDNKWEFNEKFEITKEQAKEINQVTVNKDESSNWAWWIWLIIAFVSIGLLVILFYFVTKHKKNQSQLKEKNNKKKMKK